MKIRANATFEGVVRALGGTPVNMSPADAYSAMQKGVLEGITFPAFASSDYKLYEVGKVMTRPLFGLSNVLFLINVRKLESLPPAQQKILLDEGRKLDQIGTDSLIKVAAEDEETMQANGVKTVQFGPVAPRLNAMYNEGILDRRPNHARRVEGAVGSRQGEKVYSTSSGGFGGQRHAAVDDGRGRRSGRWWPHSASRYGLLYTAEVVARYFFGAAQLVR